MSSTVAMTTSLKVTELDYEYPESLIATERARDKSRIMYVGPGGEPCEMNREELLGLFQKGDVLVVNNTRVLKRRVFADSGLEILFIRPLDVARTEWEVLCPASRWKAGLRQSLADEGLTFELIERGKPQKLRSNRPLEESFFERMGDLPLPPYIQKARGERRMRAKDASEYQSIFARGSLDKEEPGSLAAPTASFHFDSSFLEELERRGVTLAEVTLHVGLGTFLPVTADDLKDHVMHAEWAEISAKTANLIDGARREGSRIIALGTTVARTLESMAMGLLEPDGRGGYRGETDLMIRPGHGWRVVDILMTNFHQPRSTLLALVAAFFGLERVRVGYAWAIDRRFRLFSYGDLSIWEREKTQPPS